MTIFECGSDYATEIFMKQIKKRSDDTLTLRAGSSKVEPEIFAPPQTPYLGARYRQNVISWRWLLPLPTNQGVI